MLIPKFRKRLVKKSTDIVIEGFPRSGNTFVTAAFVFAHKAHPKKIASHLHAELQVLNAAKYDIPCVVIIRNPRDAILSLVIREPSISVEEAIDKYMRFHSALIPYKNKFVVATFDEVVADINRVIRRINQRFGSTFLEIEDLHENTKKIFSLIDEMEQRDSRENEIRVTHVARPDELREKMKAEKKQILEQYKLAFESADKIYNQFVGLD